MHGQGLCKDVVSVYVRVVTPCLNDGHELDSFDKLLRRDVGSGSYGSLREGVCPEGLWSSQLQQPQCRFPVTGQEISSVRSLGVDC